MVAAANKLSRWHVASRVLAATVPAFLLTNTAGILLSLVLPGERINGIATATLLSYAIYTAIIMWIFSVKQLRTVWIGLVSALVLTGGGAWLLYILEHAR